MPYDTLITPVALADNLDDTAWRIIDCRFALTAPAAGAVEYRQGHIPGAHYAHLDDALSSPITPDSGRHPLPSRAQLVQQFSQWGIDSQTQVVVYDTSHGMIAARLWWLLRWMGHEAVALLDGGLARWQREGYPVTATLPTTAPRRFVAAPPLEAVIESDALLAQLHRPEPLLIDVRAAERFRGEVEPLDRVAGHIPGAVNLPLQAHLDGDGNLLPAEQLRALYQPLIGPRRAEQVAVMCGSGVTACHTLLAMHIAGFAGARLYAGSWSEWITDPRRPIACGA